MKFGRIFALILRYLFSTRRDFTKYIESLYWPVLSIFLWGFATVYIPSANKLALAVLSAVVLWEVVFRANFEFSGNISEEILDRNLINLFASPLKFSEWTLVLMLWGFAHTFSTLAIGGFFVWLLYSLNIFATGWKLLPFVFLLLIAGWRIGLFGAGLLIYLGQSYQPVIFSICWLLSPFACVFYPIEVLPNWAQAIAKCLPTTHAFEGMRELVLRGNFSFKHFFISLILNIIWFVCALAFFKLMFEKRKEKGLSRLDA